MSQARDAFGNGNDWTHWLTPMDVPGLDQPLIDSSNAPLAMVAILDDSTGMAHETVIVHAWPRID